jgi:hypothetical protein
MSSVGRNLYVGFIEGRQELRNVKLLKLKFGKILVALSFCLTCTVKPT